VEGRELAVRSSLEALQGASEGWAYDEETSIVWLRIPDRGVAVKALISY
jgi:hypothetical protein